MLDVQLRGSFDQIVQQANDTTDEEWSAQALSDLNPIGFTLWHCVRGIDWAVNCAIQGIPEVADQPKWKGMLASRAWYGYGVSMETACEVAAKIPRADLVDYAADVQKSVLSWLDTQSETELDVVPDLEQNYRSNGTYLTSPRLEAWIKEDASTPVWRHVAGTCVGHVRVHVGEVQALRQVLRSRIKT